MKHFILVNPVSGNGKSIIIANRVKLLLEKFNIHSEIIVSEYKSQLTEIAKNLASKGKCRIYSVGGDGTLNEIISGLIDTTSEVVVIPAGTGNDFIKTISKYKSMRKIVINSIKTKATPTDVLSVNKSYYCINILSVGFDAMVAKNIDKFRKIPFISGKAKYNFSILYTLSSNRNFKLKLHTEGIIFKRAFTLIAFANGKYYGGGIKPCPHSNTTDGFADICTIESTSLLKKLIFLPLFKTGKHINNKIVSFSKTANSTVVSTKKFPVNIDGEIIYTNKLHVKVLPKSVNIIYTN